jgi:hypothetical protein
MKSGGDDIRMVRNLGESGANFCGRKVERDKIISCGERKSALASGRWYPIKCISYRSDQSIKMSDEVYDGAIGIDLGTSARVR